MRVLFDASYRNGSNVRAFSLSVKYRNVCPSHALLRRGVEKQLGARTASEICSVRISLGECVLLVVLSCIYGNYTVRKEGQSEYSARRALSTGKNPYCNTIPFNF